MTAPAHPLLFCLSTRRASCTSLRSVVGLRQMGGWSPSDDLRAIERLALVRNKSVGRAGPPPPAPTCYCPREFARVCTSQLCDARCGADHVLPRVNNIYSWYCCIYYVALSVLRRPIRYFFIKSLARVVWPRYSKKYVVSVPGKEQEKRCIAIQTVVHTTHSANQRF